MSPVRTRFAPSPTGSLHVGGVRTALYCWLIARQSKGEFVLRIEDTDQARSNDAATRGILRDMEWLGLDWDEGPGKPTDKGPYFQSERLDLYNKYVNLLLEEGLAYNAYETPKAINEMRMAARTAKRDFRFKEITYTEEELAQFQKEGRVPVVRLRTPMKEVTIEDAILGSVTVAAGGVDDFVIRKADGFPTYHFAVVVDDHLMEIDLILRGQEHMLNTHKHQFIYEGLNWDATRAGHLPIIFNPTGSKMSKRDKANAARAEVRAVHKRGGHEKDDYGWLAELTNLSAEEIVAFMKKKSNDVNHATQIAAALDLTLPMIEVMDFRIGGYFPEALLNYLALLGWSPGDDVEMMNVDELIERFSLGRINKTAARFDGAKLKWMNGEYLKALPDERLLVLLNQFIEVCPSSPLATLTKEQQLTLFSLYRGRASTFVELTEKAGFFFTEPSAWVPKVVRKHLNKNEGWARLKQAKEALAAANFSEEGVTKALQSLATDEAPMGRFAQPVRVAITGNGVSPDISKTLAFLGKEQTISRINACLATEGAA